MKSYTIIEHLIEVSQVNDVIKFFFLFCMVSGKPDVSNIHMGAYTHSPCWIERVSRIIMYPPYHGFTSNKFDY